MRLWLLAGLCAVASAAPLVDEGWFTGGDGSPDGWEVWAPRDEIAPRADADTVIDRGGNGALRLSGASNPAVFGGWIRETSGVEGEAWYRLTAHVRTRHLGGLAQRQAALVRLSWRTADGKRSGRPEYAHQREPGGDWTRVTLEAQAPPDARQARIELLLVNAPQTTVWFDDISLRSIDPPAPRHVKIASVNYHPDRIEQGTALGNVERFAHVVAAEVPEDADLIVLPEGVTVVRNGLTYAEAAETIPGPITKRLGQIAASKKAYLVAGIYEREGAAIYNTSVLLNREGEFVGKYRKVYLPREEFEGGLTPGSDFPVFETDFGRLGMMICWDVQYADPARALALRGAEIVAMPIWGGNMTLASARAIENHVFLASSGYDHPTYVMDPQGEILSRADEEGSVAVATIDLNRRYQWEWLGEMRGRFFHELRRDVVVDPVR